MNLTPTQKRKLLNQKTGRKYASVATMVRESRGDHVFAQELEYSLERQSLVTLLTAIRCQRGLKQADVARKLGCTQSKISKLEASDDNELALRDVLAYARAVGCRVQITVSRTATAGPRKDTLAAAR